jgi:hypothetical protein
MTSSMLSHFSCVLFPQLLSQGSMDVPALLAEVARPQEVAIAAEATRATAMLPAKLLPGRLLRRGIVSPSMLGMQRIGPLWRRGRHWNGYNEQRRRTLLHWPLLVRMPKASSERSPSMRMSLRRKVRLRQCLRGSAEHNSRSSPFYRLGALS